MFRHNIVKGIDTSYMKIHGYKHGIRISTLVAHGSEGLFSTLVAYGSEGLFSTLVAYGG